MSYSKNEDTGQTGDKNLWWLREYIFSKIDLSNYHSVLDVGSGNGRTNSIFKDYFDEIYNIDPFCTNAGIYNYNNVTHIQTNFEDFNPNRKFDVITFIFSFYLFMKDISLKDIQSKNINKDKTIKTIDKCLSLLNNNGCIIVVSEMHYNFWDEIIQQYNIDIHEVNINRKHYYATIKR